MSKKVLVISTSLRNGSNSETLADSFASGALAAGHDVEKISLRDKNISFCKGCLACQKTQRCVIKDDASYITDRIGSSDVVVFVTPIYYYEMSGQMKTILDRANPLFARDYSFRDVYMLSTAAEGYEHAAQRAVNGLKGWIACFGKARLAGTVFAGGVNDAGDITGHTALQKAFDIGKNI